MNYKMKNPRINDMKVEIEFIVLCLQGKRKYEHLGINIDMNDPKPTI